MADIASRLPSTDFSDGVVGSATPTEAMLIGGTDGTDLRALSTDSSGKANVNDIINVSGQYRAQSVTTSAAEALGGSTILANRKLLSIMPTNGTIYWGYNNSVTTTTGTPIFADQMVTFAVGSSVHIFIISAGTVDSRIAEGS